MGPVPKTAILLAAAALAVSVASSPAAAGTAEENFGKRVGKLAIRAPLSLTPELIGNALQKGKALCTCPSSEFVGRAGVLISSAEPQAAPLILCVVPHFSAAGDVADSYESCGNWQPLTK